MKYRKKLRRKKNPLEQKIYIPQTKMKWLKWLDTKGNIKPANKVKVLIQIIWDVSR